MFMSVLVVNLMVELVDKVVEDIILHIAHSKLFLGILANLAHPDAAGLDSSLIALVTFIAPWIVIGLASLAITTVLRGKSMQRESEAASARIKEEKEAGTSKDPDAVRRDSMLYNTPPETARRRVLIRRVLMIAAVCFIGMGILNGSMKDVLVKAIRICTECVGLG